MPATRFALFPFCINSKKSQTAEFHENQPYHLTDLISVSSEHITICASGTFLIYYLAFSKDEDICTALFLNSCEVKATRDCNINPCGGAVIFLNDMTKNAVLSLRLCSKSQANIEGFIVIALI